MEATDSKTTRHRSRSYPVIDLAEAIKKTADLIDYDPNNPIPINAAFNKWGYKDGSSHGFRITAALLQYGLIEDSGTGDERRLTPTDRAHIILESPHVNERTAALKEAVLLPPLYNELWEKHSGNLPPDKTLAYDLTRSKALNRKVVDDFILNFRSSLEFANLDGESSTTDISDDTGEENGTKPTSDPPKEQKMPETVSNNSAPYDLTILLPTGETAILRMPSLQSKETYEHLKKAITMNLELLTSAVTRSATELKFQGPNDEGDQEGD